MKRELVAAKTTMLKSVSIPEMIAALRLDHENIANAIFHLEKLDQLRKVTGRPENLLAGAKRRGRPPGSRNRPQGTQF